MQLVKILEFNGIWSCGTIKSTSQSISDVLKNPNNLTRGDAIQKQNGNIVLTVWKDKTVVHVISSGINPLGDDPVVRRIPGGDAVEITRPPTVTKYQIYMSGVDRCMQHRAKNPVGRSCKKYWKYLMNFILEICLINAYKVWKETPGTKGRKKSYKLLDFRAEVAVALVSLVAFVTETASRHTTATETFRSQNKYYAPDNRFVSFFSIDRVIFSTKNVSNSNY